MERLLVQYYINGKIENEYEMRTNTMGIEEQLPVSLIGIGNTGTANLTPVGKGDLHVTCGKYGDRLCISRKLCSNRSRR